MLHLSTAGENSNMLLIPTTMCCSSLASAQQTHILAWISGVQGCLRWDGKFGLSEAVGSRTKPWGFGANQENDESSPFFVPSRGSVLSGSFSLLAWGWGLAREKVPRSWRVDKLWAVAAKGGCRSFLPVLCFLLCCYLLKLPSAGFFTSGRGVTSQDI